jgi:1,4-dihydroxy-2-naphthoate polyprenyltransferase
MQEFRNTIQLLRFPFSLFLLPVSLFSLFYIPSPDPFQLFFVLVIWHFLVFPASNGYNSYNDKDEGPIGGLARPPKPGRQLLVICNMMDLSAIGLSFFVNNYFVFFVFAYIVASRLYSYRKIRLKQFPFTAFFVVFFFQGAWVFAGNIFALSSAELFTNPPVVFSCIASSFFIGTVYPLTQIYQHEADGKDGVKTLSMLLGIKGTFIFSGSMFALATLLVYFSFEKTGNFLLFNLVMFPSAIYFIYWAYRSFKNKAHINFKNTMIMLGLSSLSNNLCFLLLLLN